MSTHLTVEQIDKLLQNINILAINIDQCAVCAMEASENAGNKVEELMWLGMYTKLKKIQNKSLHLTGVL